MIAIRSSAIAALVAGIGFSGFAAAQTKVWNFGDTTPSGACTGTHDVVGNVINCTQQPGGTVTDLTLTAFSSSGAAYAAAAVNYHGTGSGVGVRHASELSGAPDHAMDNQTNNDMLLLSFTSTQVLKTVTLGWAHTDSDFQLLRWTGGAFVAPSSQTAAQLLSGGWSLVSTVDGGNTASTDTTYNVNAGNASSSYWLISAFNSAFGGAGTTGVDGMKVLGVTAAVAEPGSLALAGLALAAAAGLRRRSARTQAV